MTPREKLYGRLAGSTSSLVKDLRAEEFPAQRARARIFTGST
jgi:hypothetical protein